MKTLLMGIDIGTTHIKTAVFDCNGRQEALTVVDNPVFRTNNGLHFYDPVEIQKKVFTTIKNTLKQLDGEYEIAGVSVASMAEAGVPVDRHGKCIYHIIPWFDPRTKAQAEWWEKNFEPLKIYEETGLILRPKYSLNKIMWLKQNEREIYDRTAYWLCMEDYILYILSGSICTERSIANRTMAMSVKDGKWSEKMLQIAEIRTDIFPTIFNSGTVIGKVNRQAAERTLLKEGTPVVTGGHDHLCAALASGAVNQGEVFDSMGTAESLVATTDYIQTTINNFFSGFSVGWHVVDNKFYIMGGMSDSGGAVEWFCKNILSPKANEFQPYDQLAELGKEMKREPTGIFFIPHLSGSGAPNVDSNARGAFIGIRAEHTKADLLKAVYEGVSYEFRHMKERLEEISDLRINKLILGGGSTKNYDWMETKADIMNQELVIPSISQPATLGAALLAGIGVGIYKNAVDAVKNMDISCTIVHNRAEKSFAYNLLYNNGYKRLYASLKPFNEILNPF